jgi:hypothetical protein
MNAQEDQLREKPQQQKINLRDWSWEFWLALPLYPYRWRRTLCREIIKDRIWTFEQLHGFLYAVVPIRMTIIKLESGGLFVYAPVAPTLECVQMVNELVAKHGDVKYIILPTSSGLEHKVFAGPFARYFPQAQVFVAPHQWSFPFNVPLSWLGFPQKRTQEIPADATTVALFGEEFDCAVLDIDLRRGFFTEVAVFHKRSRTLLLTDSILSVPEEPPAIVQLDPYPLLFHARDNAAEAIADNQENRCKGWKRISLFAIYFRPSAVKTKNLAQVLKDAFKAPERSKKAYFGIYPFQWQENWEQSFDALRSNGRPFVAPILQTLIFPQAPAQVLRWADKIATWDFQQIISCHFDSPIAATPHQFRQAFSFLEKNSSQTQDSSLSQFFPEEDLQFIKQLEAKLIKWGIATPPKQKV